MEKMNLIKVTNEALEHNLEGKTNKKDRFLPKKSTMLVVFADLTNKVILPTRLKIFLRFQDHTIMPHILLDNFRYPTLLNY